MENVTIDGKKYVPEDSVTQVKPLIQTCGTKIEAEQSSTFMSLRANGDRMIAVTEGQDIHLLAPQQWARMRLSPTFKREGDEIIRWLMAQANITPKASNTLTLEQACGTTITAELEGNELAVKSNGETILLINKCQDAYIWSPEEWARLKIRGDAYTTTRSTVVAIAQQIGIKAEQIKQGFIVPDMGRQQHNGGWTYYKTTRQISNSEVETPNRGSNTIIAVPNVDPENVAIYDPRKYTLTAKGASDAKKAEITQLKSKIAELEGRLEAKPKPKKAAKNKPLSSWVGVNVGDEVIYLGGGSQYAERECRKGETYTITDNDGSHMPVRVNGGGCWLFDFDAEHFSLKHTKLTTMQKGSLYRCVKSFTASPASEFVKGTIYKVIDSDHTSTPYYLGDECGASVGWIDVGEVKNFEAVEQRSTSLRDAQEGDKVIALKTVGGHAPDIRKGAVLTIDYARGNGDLECTNGNLIEVSEFEHFKIVEYANGDKADNATLELVKEPAPSLKTIPQTKVKVTALIEKTKRDTWGSAYRLGVIPCVDSSGDACEGKAWLVWGDICPTRLGAAEQLEEEKAVSALFSTAKLGSEVHREDLDKELQCCYVIVYHNKIKVGGHTGALFVAPHITD